MRDGRALHIAAAVKIEDHRRIRRARGNIPFGPEPAEIGLRYVHAGGNRKLLRISVHRLAALRIAEIRARRGPRADKFLQAADFDAFAFFGYSFPPMIASHTSIRAARYSFESDASRQI